MPEFSKHQLLFSLQPDLNVLVATWITDLTDRYIYDDAYTLYDDLKQSILRLKAGELPEAEIKRLRDWLDVTPVKSMIVALNERGGWGRAQRMPPKATADQLRIIEEAQREVGLDFTRLFDELTTWEADCIIKGAVTVSEVQRQTGDRHFALRDLRAAIRNHLVDPAPSKGRAPRTFEE